MAKPELAQYERDELRAIRESFIATGQATCPRCKVAMTDRAIGGGSFGLGYARRREWLHLQRGLGIVEADGHHPLRALLDLEDHPAGAQEITVIGQQWWWEYRYDVDGDGKDDIVTANEIHIPAGRPVVLELEAADVIHSLWIPNLAGKQVVAIASQASGQPIDAVTLPAGRPVTTTFRGGSLGGPLRDVEPVEARAECRPRANV